MCGFSCEEFLGVRYYNHKCKQVSPVPMADPVVVARACQPGWLPEQLRSSKTSRRCQPSAALSNGSRHSGRCAQSQSSQGHGKSSADADRRWGSHFMPCMVAASCSMLFVLVYLVAVKARRVAIRWLTIGPHCPYGSADLPVGSLCGLGLVSLFSRPCLSIFQCSRKIKIKGSY